MVLFKAYLRRIHHLLFVTVDILVRVKFGVLTYKLSFKFLQDLI